MSSGNLKAVGSFKGTGTEKRIALDFEPKAVKVTNMTSLLKAEKFIECDLAGKEGGIAIGADGAITALTEAQGITLDGFGFKVGTANNVNKLGDHIVYEAVK